MGVLVGHYRRRLRASFWSVLLEREWVLSSSNLTFAGLTDCAAYAPILLKHKARRIKKELASDAEKGEPRVVKTIYEIEKGDVMYVPTHHLATLYAHILS